MSASIPSLAEILCYHNQVFVAAPLLALSEYQKKNPENFEIYI